MCSSRGTRRLASRSNQEAAAPDSSQIADAKLPAKAAEAEKNASHATDEREREMLGAKAGDHYDQFLALSSR
jgi:hypothetical protein